MLHGRHDRKIHSVVLKPQGQAYAIRTRSAKQLPTTFLRRPCESSDPYRVAPSIETSWPSPNLRGWLWVPAFAGTTSYCSVFVGGDLVEERGAQAVGVRIPLARPLVGGQRRRPELVGAVAAMHRQVEAVGEEQLRPFPPGAELLDPAQQVVSIDQRRRHIRGHRSKHEAGLDHAIQFANRARHLPFRDMTQAGLENEIQLAVLERHVGDRAELVELLQRFRRFGMDAAVVLDAPGIDAAG